VLRGIAAILLIAAAGACSSGTDATIVVSDEGADIAISDPNAPPIGATIDKEGVKGPPTPTPHPITPIIPVATPVPTSTPRPG
jgi:hypothetical protein